MEGNFKGSEVWTEKYRPKKFEEMVGQIEILKRVKSLTNSMNIPHLLFAGPAGTGKSTLALIIVRELFNEFWRENYLELNASDERGIDVVRQKVKDFARTKAIGNVPFKVIFLDEADALTREAQQALRRTMENFTSTCRFILSCNYSSKIIYPIQSSSVVLRFQLLEKKEIGKRINIITLNEGLSTTPEVFDVLYEASGGDCRRVINLLQATASISVTITPELINTMISQAKPADIRVVLDYALSGDFINSRDKLLDIMLKDSISGQDVIKSIQKEIWNLSIDNALNMDELFLALDEMIDEIEHLPIFAYDEEDDDEEDEEGSERERDFEREEKNEAARDARE